MYKKVMIRILRNTDGNIPSIFIFEPYTVAELRFRAGKNVQEGNDQEMAQTERKSHSKKPR